MPWGRLDDSLYDHPKLDVLGRNRLACVGLNTLATSWCNRFLTDGLLPQERVLRLGGTIALADALVEARLWERSDDGYRIHDFLDYNPSREQVLAERASARDRMRDRRRDVRGKFNGSSPEHQPNTERSSGDVRPPRPIPSRPIPIPSSGEVQTNGTTPLPSALAEIERQRARVESQPIRPIADIAPDLAEKWGSKP